MTQNQQARINMGPSSPYTREIDTHDSSKQRSERNTRVAVPARGRFGEASKITEEYNEFIDANKEGYKVLEQVELVDLVGAIIGYAQKKFNISPDELLNEAKAKNRTMARK